MPPPPIRPSHLAKIHSKKSLSWDLTPLPSCASETRILQDGTPSDISQSVFSGSECSDATQKESYLADLLAETQFSATQPSKQKPATPSLPPDAITHQEIKIEETSCCHDLPPNTPEETSITSQPLTPKAHNQNITGHDVTHHKTVSFTNLVEATTTTMPKSTPLQQPKFSQSEYIQSIKLENLSVDLLESQNSMPLQSTYPANNQILPCPPDVTLDLSEENMDQIASNSQDSPDHVPLQSTNPTNNAEVSPCPPDVTLNLSSGRIAQTVTKLQTSPELIPLQSTNPANNGQVFPCPPDVTLDISSENIDHTVTDVQDSPDPLQSTNPSNNGQAFPCPPDITLNLSSENIDQTETRLQGAPDLIPLQSTNPTNNAQVFPCPPDVTLNLSPENIDQTVSNVQASPDHVPLQSTNPSNNATAVPCPPEITLDLPRENNTQLTINLQDSSSDLNLNHSHVTAPLSKSTSFFSPGWDSEPKDQALHHLSEKDPTGQLRLSQSRSPTNKAIQVQDCSPHKKIIGHTGQTKKHVNFATDNLVTQVNDQNTTINTDNGSVQAIGQQTNDEDSPSVIHESDQLGNHSLEEGNTELFDIATREPCSPTDQQSETTLRPQSPPVTCDPIPPVHADIDPSSPNGNFVSNQTTSKFTIESTAQIDSSATSGVVFGRDCHTTTRESSSPCADGHTMNTLTHQSGLQSSSTLQPIAQGAQIRQKRARSCDENSPFYPEPIGLPQRPTSLPPQESPTHPLSHPSTSDPSVPRANTTKSTSRVRSAVPRNTRQRKKLPRVSPKKSTTRGKRAIAQNVGTGKQASRVPNVAASGPAQQTICESISDLLPIQHVLAYRPDANAFLPGEILSILPDQILVHFYDGVTQPHDLANLRKCDIKVGDVIQYIGTELEDGESQITTVRHRKRVLKFEKEAGMVEFLTNHRENVIVCCDEHLYDQLSQSFNPTEKSPQHSRFLLEAIKVIPHESRKFTGLKDRVLSEEIIAQLDELMKAQTGVGMRKKLAAANSMHSSRVQCSNIDSPSHLFQGFGILLTTAGQTSNESKSSWKRNAATPREMIEQQIRDRHGTMIPQVSDLYDLIGNDMPINDSSLEGISNNQRASSNIDHSPSYHFTPSLKHQSLGTILLLAETPLKTVKYLMALALGIPCVSTKWVTHSCEIGKRLDWNRYLMGPGPSIFLGGVQSLINIQTPLIQRKNHDLLSIFNSAPDIQIFKNHKFIYISSKPRNKSDWMETVRPILCASGATQLSMIETKTLTKQTEENCVNLFKRYDYIVLEDHLPIETIPLMVKKNSNLMNGTHNNNNNKRRKLTRTASTISYAGSEKDPLINLKIVDFEWLKQSLIYGRILQPQLYAT